MAIDSATKRYSMINFGAGDEQYPVPDGTLDAGDRAQFLGLYSGLAAVAAATVVKRRLFSLLGVGN